MPSFSISNAGNVVEGGNAVFTVTMTGSISAPHTIYYSTLPGTASAGGGDYPFNIVNQPLTFIPGGATSIQISIPTINDTTPEPNETFTVGLQTAPGAGAFAQGSATILANDAVATPPTFSISNAGNVVEGGDAVFTVTMTGSISAPHTIYYSTLPGTASAGGGDYPFNIVNQPLTFIPGGATSIQISIPTINDTTPEPNETFTVGLQTAPGAGAFAQGGATILANDAVIVPPHSQTVIRIESRPVFFEANLFDHLYLVLDRPGTDGDEVIRGGPQLTIFSGVLIEVENVEIEQSEDRRGNASMEDRGSEILDLDGRNAEDVWSIMEQHAQNIQDEQILYALLTQNSNSVVASVLNSVDIALVAGEDGNFPTNTSALVVVGEGNLLAIDTVLIGTDNADRIRGYVGNDMLSGHAGNDSLSGGGGNDTLLGGLGNDTINGGGGNDVLNGSTGNDSMNGGTGSDIYVRNAAGDVVTELAGQGNDLVQSSVTYTLPVNVERLTLTGTGHINATGNGAANILIGNNGNNVLTGGGGADTLNGLGGNDTLVWDAADVKADGGAGSDTLRVNGAGRTLNLLNVGSTQIVNVEIINLTGTGNNRLELLLRDVLELSTTTNTLRVDGNAGDTVDRNAGWVQGANQVLGANTYRSYTQGGATLLVDTDIVTMA